MNQQSLSHSIMQKQQPSWIDDPFQLGAYAFKGLTPMSHKRNLSNYSEDLVSRYAKYNHDHYELFLDMLPEDERLELARLYIEFSDRDTSECIYGNDFTINNDFTCALLAMLKNDSTETREHFSYVVCTNVLIYYKDAINELLEASCDNLLHMQMNESGYYAQQDMEHGDVFWGKLK